MTSVNTIHDAQLKSGDIEDTVKREIWMGTGRGGRGRCGRQEGTQENTLINMGIDWLGDEGSNLDRQIQNLIPPRNTKSDQ
jgi:hypothetical protein